MYLAAKYNSREKIVFNVVFKNEEWLKKHFSIAVYCFLIWKAWADLRTWLPISVTGLPKNIIYKYN